MDASRMLSRSSSNRFHDVLLDAMGHLIPIYIANFKRYKIILYVTTKDIYKMENNL